MYSEVDAYWVGAIKNKYGAEEQWHTREVKAALGVLIQEDIRTH